MNICCPYTKSYNNVLIKTISSKEIINLYKQNFNIDVSDYFINIHNVELYKNKDSGFQFYLPLNIAGKSTLYESLQKYFWYYTDWKWEHQIADNHIKKNSNILEIGCGNGAFLKALHKKGCSVTGLEMNKASESSEIKILNSSIEEHSQFNEETYDVVCFFQVLEHIPDVHSFLQSAINCLNENGVLIVSVPNNDSFLSKDDNDVLNKPPHHMGRWDINSLKSLENIFRNVKYQNSISEPLQQQHFDWYLSLLLSKYFNNIPLIIRAIYKLKLNYFFRLIIHIFRKAIAGHTMLAIYKKNENNSH